MEHSDLTASRSTSCSASRTAWPLADNAKNTKCSLIWSVDVGGSKKKTLWRDEGQNTVIILDTRLISLFWSTKLTGEVRWITSKADMLGNAWS